MKGQEINIQKIEQQFQQVGLEVVEIYVDVHGSVKVFLPLADTGLLLYLVFDGSFWEVKCGHVLGEICPGVISMHTSHRINFPQYDEVGVHSNWYGDGKTVGVVYLYKDDFFWKHLKRHLIRH